ncbi:MULTISPECIES: HPr kinase/phosphorylase [Asaia]|uniref:HPr kinase n=1 Tax=Asaia bogorensis TaxID=91915 RepID=A0A060QIH0_9PROT|nr:MULTISPECIES: HPr kinase/phosphatase C-terminal domain-containing protein [Asaia]ETC99397.1 aldolase [Asaia sp. SF2.1]MDL2171539.1 HPr kinase/phosphatase C-terminal domain-containing protein [Asaia sp. HumB]CDG38577.1 HPr kinase [Asaia bogorensis]
MVVHDGTHNPQSQDCTSPFIIPRDGQIHASCASLAGIGVVLTGQSGCGKSSLLLRLIDSGFDLVGDDRLVIRDLHASAPPALAGMIEIRGLGLVRMPYRATARLGLHVHLSIPSRAVRLPEKTVEPDTGLWQMTLNGFHADAVAIIRTALRCRLSDFTLLCGLNGGNASCLPLPSDLEEG